MICTWADWHVEISEADIKVIRRARKSLLFCGNLTLVKHEICSIDLTMGSYDGAEVCDLVGLSALAAMPKRYRNGNFGLYRDDELVALRGVTGREPDRVRKDMVTTSRSSA